MILTISNMLKTKQSHCNTDNINTNIDYYTPFQKEQIQMFKLPISYLNNDMLFPITDIVSSDLELIPSNENSNNKCIYDYLFQSKHSFSKLLIPNWKQYYTTNIPFLQDTKNIITRIDKYKNVTNSDYNLNCNRIFEIWDTIKQDKSFLERYSYIDWEIIKDFNHSESVLQFISVMNISMKIKI